jgi:hypothetical protein
MLVRDIERDRRRPERRHRDPAMVSPRRWLADRQVRRRGTSDRDERPRQTRSAAWRRSRRATLKSAPDGSSTRSARSPGPRRTGVAGRPRVDRRPPGRHVRNPRCPDGGPARRQLGCPPVCCRTTKPNSSAKRAPASRRLPVRPRHRPALTPPRRPNTAGRRNLATSRPSSLVVRTSAHTPCRSVRASVSDARAFGVAIRCATYPA